MAAHMHVYVPCTYVRAQVDRVTENRREQIGKARESMPGGNMRRVSVSDIKLVANP